MSKGRKAPAAAIPAAPTSPVAQRMPTPGPHTNECVTVAQQSERETVITLFSEPHTPAQALQVARHAAWLATQLADQLADTQAVACAAGCTWCCSLFVSASAPEILLIADYLRASCSADELAAPQ